MPSSQDYYIRLATEADRENILNFFRKFYFRDAPLSGYLKLSETGNCKELEETTIRNLDDGLTILAISENGQIIGALLSERLRYCDYGLTKNPLYNKMVQIFDLAEKPIWAEGKIENGLRREIYLKDGSVDSSWRRKGVYKKILEAISDVAKQGGYTKMWGTCSSQFAAEVLEGVGFQCVHSVKYEDYKEDGEVVFKLPAPHTHLKLMARLV